MTVIVLKCHLSFLIKFISECGTLDEEEDFGRIIGNVSFSFKA